jgi:hypothetical protein
MALASDPEVTDEMLKDSESLIETVAMFNLSKAKGAKRKFINNI